MKLEIFESIITTLKSQLVKSFDAYKVGIDTITFEEGYLQVVTLFLRMYYGKTGEEWVSWFLYERDDINENGPKAWDKDGNEICYDIPSLWKVVEELRCAIDFVEYELPIKSDGIDSLLDAISKVKNKNIE